MISSFRDCPECRAHLREIALSRSLGPEEQTAVVDYFADLLETGHTVLEAITAIETVWADMA